MYACTAPRYMAMCVCLWMYGIRMQYASMLDDVLDLIFPRHGARKGSRKWVAIQPWRLDGLGFETAHVPPNVRNHISVRHHTSAPYTCATSPLKQMWLCHPPRSSTCAWHEMTHEMIQASRLSRWWDDFICGRLSRRLDRYRTAMYICMDLSM